MIRIPSALSRGLFALILLIAMMNVCWARDKITHETSLGVAFDIDASGHLITLRPYDQANQILVPRLLEKFRNYPFIPRMQNGVAVPATVQGIVGVQGVLGKDGETRLVILEPKFQAIWIGGNKLDYFALRELFRKKYPDFTVNISIRPDGTVSGTEVKSSVLKIRPEAIAMIKDAIASWQYKVDIEAGTPQAMTAELKIRYGNGSFSPGMTPQHRPMQVGPMIINK